MPEIFLKMDFLDMVQKFLPLPKDCQPCPPCARLFDGMEDCSGWDEIKLMDNLVECINRSGLCGDYIFVATPSTFDDNDRGTTGGKLRVDVALYPRGRVPHASDGEPLRPRWDSMSCYALCKTQNTSIKADPFDNYKPGGFEASNWERRRVRAHITSYATAMFARQQRTHMFSLLFLGRSVRIIRWDHAGAIVSERVDYVDKPDFLGTFLWRFTRLDRSEQGYDTTAEMIEVGTTWHSAMLDAQQIRTEEDYKIGYFRDSCADMDRWPWWKLSIDVPIEEDSPDLATSGSLSSARTVSRVFLVGRPHFVAKDLVGRATRGYIAWDVSGKRFVYLKDCWRVDAPGTMKEGDALRLLQLHNVQCVPTLVCDGDVATTYATGSGVSRVVQTTLTQGLWVTDASDAIATDSTISTKDTRLMQETNPMKSHTHYRLVVQEIGQSLDSFQSSEELVHVLHNSIYAHAGAYMKARILHSDISAGNILVVRGKGRNGRPEIKGILNDWDLCKLLHDPDSDAQKIGRTGTWPFMSGRLLQHPSKLHELQDDLESFLHVLIYESIRFLDHNCTSVPYFMHEFFDDAYREDERNTVGGRKKERAMVEGVITVPTALGHKALTFSAGPLQAILKTLIQWFSAYYAVHSVPPEDNNSADMDAAVKMGGEGDAASFADHHSVGSFVKLDLGALLPFADSPAVSNLPALFAQPSRRSVRKEPDEQTLRLVGLLDDHIAMLRLFTKTFEDKWPPFDKRADKLPSNWKPSQYILEVPLTSSRFEEYLNGSQTSSKRSISKVDADETEPEGERKRKTVRTDRSQTDK
ncbi:hypothetical protein OE88DRAFT_1729424 [Heliocybe sulcata]|uniref:Fungal-type protein kinase domain-containing protein n=1 Tax=Heliocybe sulcata TaxID=5364 RepID=A0A5C3MKK4_9AGAM|nr:hypothetical protein OE88DRAFT_1729424 [Heliocybe sulcata]